MSQHRERVLWPGWIQLMAVLISGFLILACVSLLRQRTDGSSLTAYLLYLLPVAILLAMGALCWYFRFLEVSFGPDGVGYGFGRLRRRIPPERVLSAEIREYDWARYMGWGWRIGPHRGERAYSVLGHRRGLFIGFRDDDGSSAAVFLSCANPEAALKALGR